MQKTDIGLAIKTQRKAIGMTAEELGKHIGVDRTYVSKIEHGVFLPSDRTTKNIRKVLHLDTNFMVAYYQIKYPDIYAVLVAPRHGKKPRPLHTK
jgi:transcriptional regulator with XRE-family HTH domain